MARVAKNPRRPARASRPPSATTSAPTALCATEDDQASDLARRLTAARLKAFLGTSSPAQDAASNSERSDLDALIERAAAVFAQSIKEATRKTYVRRWRLFYEWCDSRGLTPLPASAETAMLYLAESARAADGASLGTLRGWMAAINRIHVEAGHPAPGDDPAMTLFLRTLSRSVDRKPKPQQVSALRVSELRTVCGYLDGLAINPVDIRDRALLALHQAGVGDGEIARLTWPDIDLRPHGATILIRSPRADRADRRVRLRVNSRDQDVCAVRALSEWKGIAGDVPWVVSLTGALGYRRNKPWDSRAIRRIRIARLESLGTPGSPATIPDALRLLGQQPSIARQGDAARRLRRCLSPPRRLRPHLGRHHHH